MRYGTSMVLLVLAAVLESGGDIPYAVGYPQSALPSFSVGY